MRRIRRARAFAPASVGNVGVGFDILGHALEGPGDEATITIVDEPGVHISRIDGIVESLPSVAEKNTAGRALLSILESEQPGFGLELELNKGIPLGSGMGGSAASAVAAAVAANQLLPSTLSQDELFLHALNGEAVASGSPHGDNVAASLLGGLVLVTDITPPALTALPVPDWLCCVLVHPHLTIKTRESRAALASEVPLAKFVEQSTHLAGFLIGLHRGDQELIAAHLRDVVIEPQRKRAIPGFDSARDAALVAGAYGCTLSGSGPSMFAWCDVKSFRAIGAAMQKAFARHNIRVDLYESPVAAPGASVVRTWT